MKTTNPISFLMFFSYIICATFQKSLLHTVLEAGKSKIKMQADSVSVMPHINNQDYLEENLRDITSIMVSQFLQKATYEEVQTIVKELLDLAEKCKNLKSHESPSECAHQLMAVFLDHTCNNQEMIDKHVLTDCCNANDTEKLNCFLSYKKDDADDIDMFPVLKPEQICEEGKENQGSVKERYSYETSRRYPFLYGPTILAMSACYEMAIRSCCGEDQTECLQRKIEPIRKYIKEMSLRHHHLCDIGSKFSHTIATAVEMVLLTKKQPTADFSEIVKLTRDVRNLHETCCEGNTVACAFHRSQLMNHTCSKQAALTGKLTPCCEQPAPFRGECILISDIDDKPTLPTLPLRRFTEDQFVCEQFTEKQDAFLQEFLYEYSRRNTELAVPVILRVNTIYKNLLEKCCKLENSLECYSHGKELFQKVVHESWDRVKNHCNLHEKLGESNFHDRLIIHYTKKAPQLSASELVVFTRKVAAAASKCCPLRDEQQCACVEDSAKLILGALCRKHEAEPVNAGVGHCCSEEYAFRKPCFDDLLVDSTYVSPSLPCDQVINLTENLCNVQEEDLQTEKKKLLSNLVKQKPYTPETQVQSIVVDFVPLVEKCCLAEKSETCFQEEDRSALELAGHGLDPEKL
ncbi:alpha-fetoprotein-like [Ctenodactylus gundi]